MSADDTISLAVHSRGVCKAYGARPVLQGVDLEVRRGEILGLVGVNGAGKTTLLECLVGLRQADSGELGLFGETSTSGRRKALVRVGVQLQTLELQDKITVREAVAHYASFYAKPATLDTVLERFGLQERASARFEALSSGERQRLAAALACIHSPELLVLDEPTAALDPAARADYECFLRGFRQQGGTVLLSTHDLGEAARLCDRIAVLHNGCIQQVVTPEFAGATGGALQRLRVSLSPGVAESWFAGLDGVETAEPAGNDWRLLVSDFTRATAALAAKAVAENRALGTFEREQVDTGAQLLRLIGKRGSS